MLPRKKSRGRQKFMDVVKDGMGVVGVRENAEDKVRVD